MLFFQHIMLFIMLFFFAQIMLKNMLFALHYAKIILNFASEVHFSQHSRPEQVPVLQKSISSLF